jgi:hypothetical protein
MPRRRYRSSGPERRRKHRWSPPELPVAAPPPEGNVWTATRNFADAAWLQSGVVVAVNVKEAPDEVSFTADLIREDTTNAQHRITRGMEQAQDNQPQMVIGYFAPAGRTILWVRSVGRNGQINHSQFLLSGAGSVERQDAGHAVSQIWLMPNGFYAVKIVTTAGAIGSGAVPPEWHFNLATNTTSLVYQGSGAVAGMHFWDLRYHPNTTGLNVTFPEYEVQDPNPPVSSSTIMRVGWFQGQNILGMGPGDAPDSEQNPRFRAVMLTPNFSDINQVLETCEAQDILIVCNFARSRNNWIDQTPSGPVYNHGDYLAEVNAWANHAGMRLAVQEGRVVAYVHDEPNHDNFGGTLSPFLYNEGNRAHKDIWSTIITTNRVNGNTHVDGWDGFAPVEYDAVDYGWIQYAPQHTPAGTPADIFAEHKAAGQTVNIGMILGLNWINGGHTTSVNNAGVDPCWDYNNDNVSHGIIIGGRDTSTPPFSDGQKVPCGNAAITGATVALANPGWVRACIDAALADLDNPFFLYWQHPGDTASNHPNHVAAMKHPDMVAAMRYANIQGNARSEWNGWRTPKPVTW